MARVAASHGRIPAEDHHGPHVYPWQVWDGVRADSRKGLAVTSEDTLAGGRSGDQLLAELELTTRVRLLTGTSWFTFGDSADVGVGEIRMSDGMTGVRGAKFHGGPLVTLFPGATSLSSGWDEDSAYQLGRLLADEARLRGVQLVLGPTANLHRSTLGGRLFEGFAEDPLLTGKLTAAVVRGLQDHGVGACVKHLVGNESETERESMNSVIDEAPLRELYLLPFEIAVAESDPWAMLSAYNRVNGVACTEHDLVNNQILKGEWGYRGLVISELLAARSVVATANGGLDLVMPEVGSPWAAGLVDAVRSGAVTEDTVDDHVGRLLLLAERVGALRNRPTPRRTEGPTDSEDLSSFLVSLAAAGMTVLTNRDGVLPLSGDQQVAVIGRHAVETTCVGGGSAQVVPPRQVSIGDGLTTALGSAVTVVDGVEIRAEAVPARSSFVRNPTTGEPGVSFALLRADGTTIEQRNSITATTMIGLEDEFTETVTSVVVRARLDQGGPVQLGVIGVGDWSLSVDGQPTWETTLSTHSGMMGEEFLDPPRATLISQVPDHALVEATVQLPQVGDSGRPPSLFGLIARSAPRPADEVIAEAVEAASASDVAVVVVGLTDEQETEAVDKTTLALPGEQDRLVYAVAAAAPRTVVVVNAATPVLMPWLDAVDAVLWAGLPGQEAGHAVAAALLGTIEPSGRLVTTFPSADGAAPAWSVTPTDGDLVYREGTFVGYRGHFAGTAPEPTFWFGHGLGYTTWRYNQPVLLDGTDPVAVEVAVTNVGGRASRELVQLYFDPADPAQPVRLVGWAAAVVRPGDTAQVTVTGDSRLWRRWDAGTGTWTDLPRTGRLLVARGLGDIRGTVTL